MRKNRFLTRLASGGLVFAVAAGGLLSAGAAQAQQELPPLGMLTITPPTGTDLTTPLTVTTSGGCTSTGANAYNVRVTGPNGFDFVMVGQTSAGFSAIDPFTAPFGQTMRRPARCRYRRCRWWPVPMT